MDPLKKAYRNQLNEMKNNMNYLYSSDNYGYARHEADAYAKSHGKESYQLSLEEKKMFVKKIKATD